MSPRKPPVPRMYRVLTERDIDGQRVRTGNRVKASEIHGILLDEAERQPGTLITLVVETCEWEGQPRWSG